MLRWALGLTLVAGLVLAVAACSPTAPDEDPGIRGTITTITPAAGGGSILVETPQGEPTFDYDKAMVRITDDTDILRLNGSTYEEAAFADLEQGQWVDVWFAGAVAESYPVQGTAKTVLIRE